MTEFSPTLPVALILTQAKGTRLAICRDHIYALAEFHETSKDGENTRIFDKGGGWWDVKETFDQVIDALRRPEA